MGNFLSSLFKDKKKRKLIVSSLGMAITIATIFVAIVFGGFAWYSSSGKVEGNGISITSTSDTFELYRDNDIIYSDGVGYQETIIDFFENKENYTRDNETTMDNSFILCLMEIENGEKIEPGSYGKVTFYIIPKTTEPNQKYNINISLVGYADNQDYDEEEDDITLMFNRVQDATLDKLMLGHILFFENRTKVSMSQEKGPYNYSGRIENNYLFDTTGVSKVTKNGNECYEVNLYWIWAISITQIVFETGNPKLHYTPIFSDSNNAERLELIEIISAEPEYYFFFENNQDASIVYDSNGTFINTYYAAINNGYNNGDQYIGDNVHYLATKFTVNTAQ